MVRFVALSVVVLVLSGCPGGGAPIEVPADPMKATGTLDAPRAASKRFGWHSGGELSATSADGVVFTLSVPDTALTEDTTITMTPYATLTTPLGETSWGVQLEPEGLFPTDFLELSITPPAAMSWPVDQQVPFSLAGSANVVSLGLVNASSSLKLSVSHFSSYGLALAQKGFSASLEAARHRLGGDVEAQLENQLGEGLLKERQAVLLTGEPQDLLGLMTDFGKRYLEQVVKPRLAAAKDSCANARLAAQTTLGFERMNQLVGLDTSSLGFTFSFEDLFKNNTVCMKEEYELCRDNHIVTRIIPAFLGVLRQAALLGFDSQNSVSINKIQGEQYLGKCLKFDLELTSSLRYSTGSGIDTHSVNESMHLTHATAAYTVTTDELGGSLPAALVTGAFITGTFTDFTTSGFNVSYANNCVSVTSETPGPGQLAMATVAFSAREGDPATRAHVKDFSLVLSLLPNSSSHEISQRSRDSNGACTGTPTVDTLQENWSTLGFAPWLGSLNPASADAYVTGWTIVSGDILATKDVVWNDGNGAAFTGSFILRHVPDPQ